MTERVTDYLIADHVHLGALLADARAGDPLDGAVFARFRLGLLRHLAIEDKLLFPAVRSLRSGAPLTRALDLRIAHAVIASLLVPTPDLALAAELAAVLAAHDAEEAGPAGVYAECERILGEDRSTALAVEARGYGQVRASRCVDGAAAHRTAAAAFAAARRWHQRRLHSGD